MIMGTNYAIPRFHQANDGVCVYVNVAIMSACATQLSRIDTVQNVATALCHVSFIPLQHCSHAAAIDCC